MPTNDEKNHLYMMLEDKESGYGAKIILLKDDGYTAPEIRKMTIIIMIIIKENGYTIDSMKKGLMVSYRIKKHNHKQQYKFDNNIEKKIVDITSLNPREDYGLGFST